MSHPSWVCGLKLYEDMYLSRGKASHPSWVCGLKLGTNHWLQEGKMSHPSWVCGLKLLLGDNIEHAVKVTPFVGVWIETE